mgnify:CR=1 FL=1
MIFHSLLLHHKQRAAGAAEHFLEQFTPAPWRYLSHATAYISGAAAGVILLLTLGDASMLSEQTVLGRPLLWHLAVASFVLALSRAVMPPGGVHRLAPAAAMSRLRSAVGWTPAEWGQRPGSAETYKVRRRRNTYTQNTFQSIPLSYKHPLLRN